MRGWRYRRDFMEEGDLPDFLLWDLRCFSISTISRDQTRSQRSQSRAGPFQKGAANSSVPPNRHPLMKKTVTVTMYLSLSYYQNKLQSLSELLHFQATQGSIHIADKGELWRMCESQGVFDQDLSILSKTSFINVTDQTGLSLENTKKKISSIQLKEGFWGGGLFLFFGFFFCCHSRFSSSVRCPASKVTWLLLVSTPWDICIFIYFS